MLEKTKISNSWFILAKVMLLVRVGGNLSNAEKKERKQNLLFSRCYHSFTHSGLFALPALSARFPVLGKNNNNKKKSFYRVTRRSINLKRRQQSHLPL